MKSPSLNDWLQGITGIAIVVGLVLVVWELQQNREATTSQLTSDGFVFHSAANLALMGEQTAEVLAKACDSPNNLSRADYYVLDAYYSEVLNRSRRIVVLQQRGSFYEEAVSSIGVGLAYLLDSAPGRAYLKMSARRDTELSELIQNRLKNWDGTTCAAYFGEWLDLVDSELDK